MISDGEDDEEVEDDDEESDDEEEDCSPHQENGIAPRSDRTRPLSLKSSCTAHPANERILLSAPVDRSSKCG